MLRARVVTVLTFYDGVLFRTKKFDPDYRYTANFVDAWAIDEIVALDITRDRSKDKTPFYKAVEKLASNCFVPLTVGGGVTSEKDFATLLGLGADKVSINTAAYHTPELIQTAAQRYGSQCVVVSIDAKRKDDGSYEVYTNCGADPTGLGPVEWAKQAQEHGAGEILLTSMDHDGSLEGYDNQLNAMVTSQLNIPVLVCGGAGKWQDFVDGVNKGGASALCTTNIYHFTASSISSAKQFMNRKNVNVRV